jgi:hypothetical protein
MKEVWNTTLYPEGQSALTQDEIPLAELYSVPGYLTALLECWHNWTLKSVANTISFVKQHPELQQECLVVCDGFGASSVMWALAFPNLKVRAHIMGDVTTDLFMAIKTELGLDNLEMERTPTKEPIVLAFECFEHFYAPQQFAEPVLQNCKMLVHSSPWNVPAHGHFREYLMDGAVVPNSEMSRLFGRWIKSLGFVSSVKQYQFRFWNGDPELYFRQ